ncbi:hypothetical protein H1W37_05900 [Stappia taiwanensis]|uniref:Uncharacterized protein n=1 Tax=Stappia taiwanensis TaxID=992267 RepID=A0A838XM27_9HYPH|nr:hypothetical protein [Stappia taiwanensis]MBA4611172.1 hypothetical protein [Stappia taiwanensis]GGE86547.1 hypothetical protein GCM10007285_12660 [Stappia taiwanensis]
MRIRTSSKQTPRRQIVRAIGLALIGAVPPALFASSARAAGTSVADDWTIGLLSLTFGAMLVVLTILAGQMSRNFQAGMRARIEAARRLNGDAPQ